MKIDKKFVIMIDDSGMFIVNSDGYNKRFYSLDKIPELIRSALQEDMNKQQNILDILKDRIK